jgi:hypothetical protein
MVIFPDSEFYGGAFSASGVMLPHGVTNGQTYSWASSRDENGKALENNITGILETDYRYSPHLT